MVGNDNSKMISINISMEIESNTPIESILTMLQTQEDNLAPSITIKNLSKNNTLSFDGNQVIEFLISFSMSIASGVIGNYIYNAIHSSARKIEINNRRTRLTEESISQAIETAKELLTKTEEKSQHPIHTDKVAVTVRVAGAEADIHSGADADTVETVLRVLKS